MNPDPAVGHGRPAPAAARLSTTALQALQNLAAGRPVDAHVRGRSAAGGFIHTLVGLQKRGLIVRALSQPELTDAGRAALSLPAQGAA